MARAHHIRAPCASLVHACKVKCAHARTQYPIHGILISGYQHPLWKTRERNTRSRVRATGAHARYFDDTSTSAIPMYVPTMSIPEAIADAKADLPSVQRKMLHAIQEQERRHRRNRSRPLDQIAEPGGRRGRKP